MSTNPPKRVDVLSGIERRIKGVDTSKIRDRLYRVVDVIAASPTMSAAVQIIGVFACYMVYAIICSLMFGHMATLWADIGIVVLGAVWLVSYTYGAKSRKEPVVLVDDSYPETSGFDALCAVVLGVIALPVTIGVGGWMAEHIDKAERAQVSNAFGAMGGWAFVVVLLFAPIAEELVFRGAMIQRVFPHFVCATRKQAWTVWLLTAGLFALIHGTPSRMIYTLALGMYLMTLRQVCYRFTAWSFVLCVFVHMLYNFTSGLFTSVYMGAGTSFIVCACIVAFCSLISWQMIVAHRFAGKQLDVAA